VADPGRREQVVRFATQHGPRAAARHFGVKLGTVKGWQGRARKRQQTTAAQRHAAAVARLVEWAAAGACLRCGGAGYLSLPHPARRYAYRVVCPDCGRPRRALAVTGNNLSLAMRSRVADLQAVRRGRTAGTTGTGRHGRERRHPRGHRPP
jgi:hypothetical protein